MTCEHCGRPMAIVDQACPQCGASEYHAQKQNNQNKVIPFRPRKKAPHKAKKSPQTPPPSSAITWWIIGIIVVAVILPYIYPNL